LGAIVAFFCQMDSAAFTDGVNIDVVNMAEIASPMIIKTVIVDVMVLCIIFLPSQVFEVFLKSKNYLVIFGDY
jgi:hypothetical protein